MIKSVKKLCLALFAVTVMSGCAVANGPVYGGLFTQAKGPVAATSNTSGTKMGTSEAISILGLVGTGDASISAAMQNGGIKSITHVDNEVFSVLGLFARYTTVVYGK